MKRLLCLLGFHREMRFHTMFEYRWACQRCRWRKTLSWAK